MPKNKSFFLTTHMFLPIRENVGVFIIIGSLFEWCSEVFLIKNFRVC